jgi:hypothetical protein
MLRIRKEIAIAEVLTMTPCEFWLKAAQWGSYMTDGDPGACLYGFDERGAVQSEAHRQRCITYLDGECRHAADVNDDPTADHAELDSLIAYLQTAPIVAYNPR